MTTVAISPSGRYVAAGSLDKSVRIWDTQTATLVERTEGEKGHKDSVYSVAFSPQGNHLVSGSLDKTIRMWKLSSQPGANGFPQNGECIRTFTGHKDFVLSVALTPDGQWVMSGSKDRGVQFWDPDSGDAQLMLQGHKNSGEFCNVHPVGSSTEANLRCSHLSCSFTNGRALRHGIGRHEGEDMALLPIQRPVSIAVASRSPLVVIFLVLAWRWARMGGVIVAAKDSLAHAMMVSDLEVASRPGKVT